MAAGLEGLLGDVVMSVMNGQIDDDVHCVIGEEVVERSVGSAAMLLGKGRRSDRIQVRGGDETDLRVGEGVPRISPGDVAGSDDSDTKLCHGWRLRHRRGVG